MLSKLVPILVLILGLGAGGGAALFLKPDPDLEADETEPVELVDDHVASNAEMEFVKLSNQFVVPVVANDRVTSLVVISLSLEVETGLSEKIYAYEPKLRDGFLQVLFDHANMGGFQGAFTQAENLELLRSGLREIARNELGDQVQNVLITDIARQDV